MISAAVSGMYVHMLVVVPCTYMVPCIYAYSRSEHPWQGENSSVDDIMFGT